MTAPISAKTSVAARVATPVTGAAALVEGLRREGVERVFGYPGGAAIPIFDAIDSRSQSIAIEY